MKFVTVRCLRDHSAWVWKELEQEGELVVTSNGRPVAIVMPTNERDLKQSLRDLRQARALRAVRQVQGAARAAGQDR